MNQSSVEMENYKNKVASFTNILEKQPTTGDEVARINDKFYVAIVDGKRVIRQYGVPEGTKAFLNEKIAEMGLTREIEPIGESSTPAILVPEYAEL